MIRQLRKVANALTHYRNPAGLALQRLSRRPVHTITDRATGLTFRSRAAAAPMLTETFHQHAYDLPAVPLREGDVVLDIGANHGFFACYAAGRGARVHAFEPSASLQGFIRDNVRTNGLTDRVTVHPCAVGARDGEVTFYETGHMGGGMNSTRGDWLSAEGVGDAVATTVPCVSFAGALRLCGEPAPIRLLKVDCEGAELDILRSLTPTDLARIDGLAVEFHPGAYPLEELFELVMGWPDFHLSLITTGEVPNDMIHLTSGRALREWVRHRNTSPS